MSFAIRTRNSGLQGLDSHLATGYARQSYLRRPSRGRSTRIVQLRPPKSTSFLGGLGATLDTLLLSYLRCLSRWLRSYTGLDRARIRRRQYCSPGLEPTTRIAS